MGRAKLFMAVDPGDSVRRSAVDMQRTLTKTGATVHWAASEGMHVTLYFLGDVDERELHSLCRAMSQAAATVAPFRLAIGGLGAFPSMRRPKVIWAAIEEGTEELSALHTALETRLDTLGFYQREERGYTPHLTLGRVKEEADGQLLLAEFPKHATWQGGDTLIEEIALYASDQTKDGPIYSVVGRAELTGRPKPTETKDE